MTNLSRKFIFLILLLCSARAGAAGRSTSDPAWMVKVGSTYIDQADPAGRRRVPLQGAGFLAVIDGRYFVVTDSHLSGGDASGNQLSLRLPGSNDQVLKPLGDSERLTYSGNRIDLDLIGVAKPDFPIHPIFVYNSQTDLFELEDSSADPRQSVGPSRVLNVADSYLTPIPSWVRGETQGGRVYDSSVAKFWPSSDGTQLDSRDEIRDSGVPGLLPGIVADSKIAQGMSGSPLLSGTKRGKTVVFGLSQSYHRYFPRSQFSDPSQLKWLVDRFRAGQRGKLDSSHWRYRSKVGLYLNYGDGSLEILPDSIPTGGGDSGEGGGGDSAEGGERVGSHSGGSNYGGLGLQPGMQWQGRPVIAFQISHYDVGAMQNPFKTFIAPSYTIYANGMGRDYVDRIREMDPTAKVVPIGAEKKLIELFIQRAQAAPLIQARPGTRSEPYSCMIDDRALSKGKIRIRIQSIQSKELLELGANGEVIGRNKASFEPFVKLPNQTVVDIKGLFFTDPTDMRRTTQMPQVIAEKEKGQQIIRVFARYPYIYSQTDSTRPAVPAFCVRSPFAEDFDSSAVAYETLSRVREQEGCLREEGQENLALLRLGDQLKDDKFNR